MGNSYDQEALLKRYDDESDYDEEVSAVAYLKRVSTPSPPLFFSLVINLACLILIIFMFHRIPQISDEILPFPQLVYSPAQNILVYQAVTFDNGFENEGDEAWENLYSKQAIVKIPEEEAKRLPNTTLGMHDEPGQYVVGLEVFHQLQCLDRIRKSFSPERYSARDEMTVKEVPFDEEDLAQCVDSIRQTLMCNADISTIHWEWNEEQQRAKPRSTNTHTCRNFGAIQQWALDHQVGDGFDMHVKPTWSGSNA